MYSTVAKKKKSEPTPFGQKLREFRLAAGMTQLQLGELVGMAASVVRRLESSPDANPTLATIQALAKALEISSADLIIDPDDSAE